MASTDSRPIPIKNTAYRVYFGIYKNDGTLITGASGLDSEVSKDGAAFADCTNEATEIGSSGTYYLDLTNTEMNADNVMLVVKTSSTGAVIPTMSLCPNETGDIDVDVTALLGTAWLTPGTAGTPDVNVKLWNALTTVELPLVPTTAGRKLDVSAGGEAGLDWANIGSPTTAQNLSATNIDVDQVVASVSGAVGTVNALAANVITATAINADAFTAAKFAADVTTELQSGLATAAELAKVPKSDSNVTWNATALASINAEADTALADYDAPTKAELDAAVANVSVDEIQASALADLFNTDSGTTYGSAVAGSVVAEIADNAGGTALTEAGIADAVWDEILATHVGVGSAGAALLAAGGSGDPWATALPGAYGSGTAGKIIGDNINATVSSRATQTSVDTIDDFLDTEVAAILADTNELQTDWANGGRLDLILDARASQTSVDDLPTNAELATSQAAADDATLAAIAALNNLSAAQVNAEVDTALADYDAPTNAEMVARTLAAASYATAAALATTDGKVDTVDTVVDAVKAKTDSLTFTTAGMVDSAIKRVGDTTLNAAGTGGQGYGA